MEEDAVLREILQDHYATFRLKGGTHEKYVKEYAGKLFPIEDSREIERDYNQNGPSERARKAFELARQQCSSAPTSLARAA